MTRFTSEPGSFLDPELAVTEAADTVSREGSATGGIPIMIPSAGRAWAPCRKGVSPPG